MEYKVFLLIDKREHITQIKSGQRRDTIVNITLDGAGGIEKAHSEDFTP
jgi:hypothetical protein